MNSFSRIITLLRKEKGITQKKAAADLGISQALLSHYEKGLRECGLDFLVKLCAYYNVSADYILGISQQRDGSVLSINDLDTAESVNDSHYQGSVLPAMNKRLVSSSLNIIYDMLSKANNKELTKKVSEYFSLSIYHIFRMLFSSEKNNSEDMFSVNESKYSHYTLAQLQKTSADLDELLSRKDVVKQRGDAFEMTSESMAHDYPRNAAALTNTIKTAEDLLK